MKYLNNRFKNTLIALLHIPTVLQSYIKLSPHKQRSPIFTPSFHLPDSTARYSQSI